MSKPKKPKFSDWLQQSLQLLGRLPWMWAGYALFVGVLLVVGRISPALGIFSAVTSLFLGVGLAKYSDLKTSSEHPVNFYWAVNKSLPLAVIAAGSIVVCWFVFMAIACLLAGEADKIPQFFFHWELTAEHFNRQSTREIADWIYSYANVALIFTLLMQNSFIGWFTHPLMLFNDARFSQAKEQSQRAVSKNQQAIYKLLGFIFVEAVLCTTVTPLLTPVLYVLVSVMMYVSYKSIFELKPS
ncbi:MAG: hypothetical protein Q7U57_16775 [Methylovulum sp.]|nr:hypothetical protein [Methylovulum sp.]